MGKKPRDHKAAPISAKLQHRWAKKQVYRPIRATLDVCPHESEYIYPTNTQQPYRLLLRLSQRRKAVVSLRDPITGETTRLGHIAGTTLSTIALLHPDVDTDKLVVVLSPSS